MSKVSNPSLIWQISVLALQTEKLHGEESPSLLLKYVLFKEVDAPHPPEKVQQTPKPLAQLPEEDPPKFVHSVAV